MNKKGFTVVELIVSVTLTFVIVSLLFQVLLSLRDVYVSSGIRTQLLNKQTIISSKINEDLYNKNLEAVLKCGRNCLNFIYSDGSNARLVIDVSNHIFSYGDYSTELVSGSRFNDVDIRVEKTDGVSEAKLDSVLIVKVPINHNFFDTNYGVNILYPFNSRNTSIEDVVFDGYNDQEVAVLLKGSSNMKVYQYTEPGWYTIEGDNDLIENDPRVEVVGEVDNETYGVYELEYIFRIDDEVVDIKTRTVEIIDECSGTIIDYRDGNTYKITRIGEQCWFAENLAYTTTECLNADFDSSEPYNACRIHGPNEGSNQGSYMSGIEEEVLYQWELAMDGSNEEGAEGICPAGFRIPSDDDFKEMETFLGLSEIDLDETGLRGTTEGEMLKSEIDWDGSNDIAFNAIPSGYRSPTIGLIFAGQQNSWLTSSLANDDNVWTRSLFSDSDEINRSIVSQSVGNSIRCILNN